MNGEEAKNELINLLQKPLSLRKAVTQAMRHCKRPLVKGDIVYKTSSLVPKCFLDLPPGKYGLQYQACFLNSLA